MHLSGYAICAAIYALPAKKLNTFKSKHTCVELNYEWDIWWKAEPVYQ